MINNEAHKRKEAPDRADYSAYTTMRNGEWHLINGNGKVLGVGDKDELSNRANFLMQDYTLKINDYLIHKRTFPQYYIPTYSEANFTHKLIYLGFKPNRDFDPYDNWMGLSKMHPEVTFTNGDKDIYMVLNGHITMTKGGEVVYFDKNGTLPSLEILENFAKS